MMILLLKTGAIPISPVLRTDYDPVQPQDPAPAANPFVPSTQHVAAHGVESIIPSVIDGNELVGTEATVDTSKPSIRDSALLAKSPIDFSEIKSDKDSHSKRGIQSGLEKVKKPLKVVAHPSNVQAWFDLFKQEPKRPKNFKSYGIPKQPDPLKEIGQITPDELQ